MLPIILYIDGQKISLFGITIIVSMIVFFFSGWLYLRKEIEINKVFDVLIFSLVNYLFFSRLFGVIENSSVYLKDLSKVFDFKDNNFSFIGLFIGFIVSVIFINKLLIKQHQNKRAILEHIFLIFMISIIPLLLGNFLTGRMLGIEVTSSIGFSYDDGSKRMPISLFRIIFFSISLFLYQVIRKNKSIRLTNIIAGFFMGFAAFEVVIITFTNNYQPIIYGIINIEQLNAIFIFILGMVILLGKTFSKLAYDEQGGSVRKTREELFSNINTINYSYSFKDMNLSINQSELSLKEKLRMLTNSIKRRYKK